jgi:hypothetical protein
MKKMRSDKDLTPLEQEALNVHTIINDDIYAPMDKPLIESNFNKKKFIATCKKNRKKRKLKKQKNGKFTR